jgi:hypothetical protein
MVRKPWQKALLSMVTIVAGGFVLFNLSFLLAVLVTYAIKAVSGGVAEVEPYALGVYFVLLGILSWFIFRSKLNDLLKALYLTMPLMTVLVGVGIALNAQPKWIRLAAGAVAVFAVLAYLVKRKLSWMYVFAAVFVGVMGLIIVLANIQI